MFTRVRTFVNTVCFGGGAVVWLGLSALCAAPFLYFFPGKNGQNVRRFVYVQSRGIVFFIRLCSAGLTVHKHPRPATPCVVVANHASALDLYTVSALGFNNVVYITKGWVFKLPFFRFVMHGAGYLDAQKTPPEELLAKCQQAVQNGCDIVLFPQGSRKDPQARFKSGAFYLAEKLTLPVVPVAIAGTGKMLPSGTFLLRPARVVLKAFKTVYPQDFSGPVVHLEMARMVRKTILDFVNKEEAK